MDVAELYYDFTPELIEKWEAVLKENPDAVWNENRMADILPFIRAVMPRIGRNQSLLGLSLISIRGQVDDIEGAVRYGLEPLLTYGILKPEEAVEIVEWYRRTVPGDPSTVRGYSKNFQVGGVGYEMWADCYAGCRDLNLRRSKQ
ncbi:MAG: hypothetical protein J4428_03760 [Candidatus Aenigmarchaeota archaeon]|nr:hypothetical protein [Candidatus Aenigmarchaeota archaeon]